MKTNCGQMSIKSIHSFILDNHEVFHFRALFASFGAFDKIFTSFPSLLKLLLIRVHFIEKWIFKQINNLSKNFLLCIFRLTPRKARRAKAGLGD
jgi:hypothetical protein